MSEYPTIGIGVNGHHANKIAAAAKSFIFNTAPKNFPKIPIAPP
jgi:hypothetical protein